MQAASSVCAGPELLYAEDHDRFPPNPPSHQAGLPEGEPAWTAGCMGHTEAGDLFSDHATDTGLLLSPGVGKLGPYAGSAPPFKCPADRRLARAGSRCSFADGHVELRRWKDPRTSPPVTGK